MSFLHVVGSLGRLGVGVGGALLSLGLDRHSAVQAFRHSLKEAGLPAEAIEELVQSYPRLNVRDLANTPIQSDVSS